MGKMQDIELPLSTSRGKGSATIRLYSNGYPNASIRVSTKSSSYDLYDKEQLETFALNILKSLKSKHLK